MRYKKTLIRTMQFIMYLATCMLILKYLMVTNPKVADILYLSIIGFMIFGFISENSETN